MILVAKKEVMNLIQFQKAFQTEDACHRHFVNEVARGFSLSQV
jgi:hypothetical protein